MRLPSAYLNLEPTGNTMKSSPFYFLFLCFKLCMYIVFRFLSLFYRVCFSSHPLHWLLLLDAVTNKNKNYVELSKTGERSLSLRKGKISPKWLSILSCTQNMLHHHVALKLFALVLVWSSHASLAAGLLGGNEHIIRAQCRKLLCTKTMAAPFLVKNSR